MRTCICVDVISSEAMLSAGIRNPIMRLSVPLLRLPYRAYLFVRFLVPIRDPVPEDEYAHRRGERRIVACHALR